jgi:hypothetical protein
MLPSQSTVPDGKMRVQMMDLWYKHSFIWINWNSAKACWVQQLFTIKADGAVPAR